MKRKFEGKEMAFAVKGLENKRNEKEWIEYQLEYHKLMLEKGLMMNYKKNVRDFKVKKHEFDSELMMVEETIKVLENQIRDGVEVDVADKVKDKLKGGKE